MLRAAPDFAAIRAREFARLDARDHAYLDYTGAALYAASQLSAHHAALADGIFGNPHAEHESSKLSDTVIDEARAAVLEFLGASAQEYAVIFTANTTAAVKLVAESFAFGPHSPLVLTGDNHNSVNGLREYARRSHAPVTTLSLGADLRLEDAEDRLTAAAASGCGLFAFPAQSNFSGVQHPLSLVRHAQALGFRVLVDAAAFVPTNRLNLRDAPADFVPLSFYKLFGFPTGIGALVARREALAELRRPWFSGGTVDFVSIQHDRHQLRRGELAFEDGTPNFLGIAAVRTGLEFLDGIGLDAIHQHVCVHAHAFLNGIAALAHANGEPLVEIYGPGCAQDRGATIAFNIKNANGQTLPYPSVEERARSQGIAVRGGCFCNPGAAEAAFAFDAVQTANCLAAVSDDFTIARFAACLGDYATVGAVRASFGVPTNARDVARAIALVESFLE